jgi:hypothetical protein
MESGFLRHEMLEDERRGRKRDRAVRRWTRAFVFPSRRFAPGFVGRSPVNRVVVPFPIEMEFA